MNDRDLHFHDLRGTAVTKLYSAGLPERVIAEIMAWEEKDVAQDHPALRRPGRRHQGAYPSDQRKENVTCKTADKTHTAILG